MKMAIIADMISSIKKKKKDILILLSMKAMKTKQAEDTHMETNIGISHPTHMMLTFEAVDEKVTTDQTERM